MEQYLDEMLRQDSQSCFERFAVRVRPDLAPLVAIREVEKWIRRRAIGRTVYVLEGLSRTRRTGLKWTWIEDRVMEWAFSKPVYSDGKRVTEEYISELLLRSVDEIKDKRNTKAGIKGFGL